MLDLVLTKFDLMWTCCCCRCQEGAFQYMVAFEQPHHAVQWCLLVQVRYQSNCQEAASVDEASAPHHGCC
jgi:hypothetical protein